MIEKRYAQEKDRAFWFRLDKHLPEANIPYMADAVYPKKYLSELRNEINEAKEKIASGEIPVFDSVDALFDKLEMD